MLNNLINIGGVISIVVSIWAIIFTIRNKDNMPPSIRGLKRENYKIIDKENFNKIMVIKEICMIIVLMTFGVLIIITETGNFIYILLSGGVIDLYLSNKSKKYIIEVN